jgi:hypothetical protein
MTLPLENLRAHVLWRPTEGMRALFFGNNFAETEVRQLEVPIDVNENVLWLDISIDHIEVMEVLETQQELSEVKFGLWLGELLYVSEMEEHLSAGAEVHDEE